MTDEQRTALIAASTRYLLDIGRILDDSTAALEIFDRIGDAIDPGVKGEVLLALLTGNGSSTIRISCGTLNRADAIPLIRTIREISLCGLKEAKDIYDGLMTHPGKFYEIPVQKLEGRYNYVERLRAYGLIVQ